MQETSDFYSITENNKLEAKKHLDIMKTFYHGDITDSINNSVIYYDKVDIDKSLLERSSKHPKILFLPFNTNSAIRSAITFKTVALDFASYLNPGGGFEMGYTGQEEAICSESNLCNILKGFKDYYTDNSKNMEKNMYKNRALYLKDVLFPVINSNCNIHTDIIACTAPNRFEAKPSDYERFEVAMRSRIRFIRDIFIDSDAELMILGAFGCGAHGWDAYFVKDLIIDSFYPMKGLEDKTLLFAVPADNKYNYNAFESIVIEYEYKYAEKL